ncbi:cytochrome P450 714C2-like [Aristolochia californica]|uniref:cytochrome P450 714C2-like n=1 Tax=Aristolochia californica TaxID=171875 RepID=UPI0035D788F2
MSKQLSTARHQEKIMELLFKMLFSLFLVSFLSSVFYFYFLLWLRPERMREKLRRQGITGPQPAFFYGNALDVKRILAMAAKQDRVEGCSPHDIEYYVFPHLHTWTDKYGPVFLYSRGNMSVLEVAKPELARDILLHQSLDIGRPNYIRTYRGALLGRSIITANGEEWVQHRKIIGPQFYAEKVKSMVDLMEESVLPLLKSWESRVESGGSANIRVDQEFKDMSADIISRVSFGSCFAEGKDIFSKLKLLHKFISQQMILSGIPGVRHLPTRSNREVWRLDEEIKTMIVKVVEKRKGMMAGNEIDLLQALLDSVTRGDISPDMTHKILVENSKAIYFAGHETVSTSASWAMLLLALYPEWQIRVRNEVEEIFKSRLPTAEMLEKMKVVKMVILETLRLYPTTSFIEREPFKDMKFGDFSLPKGIIISIPVYSLHRSVELWGPDALEFNPERFANGIRDACKFPELFMPFGLGPRMCLGQNFAITELKIVISLILSRFKLSLPPNYVHSAAYRMILEPENEVIVNMKTV